MTETTDNKPQNRPEEPFTHFIGIGGAGMSAIAQVLNASGCDVQGSDRSDGRAVKMLRQAGIPVFIGHNADNVAAAGRVVYTRAVPEDNPELIAACERGIPVIERAEMLGLLYERFPTRVSVTGSHGKTSTSAMLASILIKCGLDPTVLIGGESLDIGGHARLGRSGIIVAEACEAYASFLHLRSSFALITNVDADHLDFYHTFDGVKQAFRDFISRVDSDGVILACSDNAPLMELRGSMPASADRKWRTYGYAEGADYRITNLHETDKGETFAVTGPDWRQDVRLPAFGPHLASNAAGALAAAVMLGCDPLDAATSLKSYGGVARRMELKGRVSGVTVVDDYAHHPSEISMTLEAARKQYPGRLTVIFQPHLYSRTAEHLEAFARSLSSADRLVITNVYAAREAPEKGVQADALFALIKEMGHNDAHYVPDLAHVAPSLSDRLRAGDTVMTVGAGDVFEAGEYLLALLRANPAAVVQV